MSRRKLHFKREAAKAKDVNKIIPGNASGAGTWLSKTKIEGRETAVPTNTKGSTVTVGMGSRKEALVRQWAK